MKKLLLLLLLSLSFNSYGESYICTYESYDFEKKVDKIRQLTLTRTDTGFTSGELDYLVQEDYSYLLLTNKFITTGNNPVVRTVLINKLNGDSVSVTITTQLVGGRYSLGGENLDTCTLIP